RRGTDTKSAPALPTCRLPAPSGIIGHVTRTRTLEGRDVSANHAPELPPHLRAALVGLLLALDGVRQARENLHDHVCEEVAEGCSCCRRRRSWTLLPSRPPRLYGALEAASAGLVDGDEVDDALVRLQELLDGSTPGHLAGVVGGPQRAAMN